MDSHILTIFAVLLLPCYSIAEKCLANSKENNVTFNREFVEVVFNPYVTYDTIMLNSFTEEDGKFLLDKVHSKFDRIATTINPNDLEFKVDLQKLSMTAAARINEKINSTWNQMKVTVIIVLGNSKEAVANQVKYLINVINETNDIYHNTIDRILVDGTILTKDIPKHFRMFRDLLEKEAAFNYSLGLQVDLDDLYMCHPSSIFRKREKNVPIINEVLRERRDFTHLYLQFRSNKGNGKTNLIFELYKNSRECLKDIIKNNSIGITSGWFGDKKYGNVNFTEFVNYWQTMNKFAETMNVPVIIYQAFDTPIQYNDKDVVGMESSGWWRLIPSSKYENVSDFKFVNKTCLMDRKLYKKFEKIDLTWLKKRRMFGKHFGITLHLKMFKDINPEDDLMYSELTKIVELLSNTFTKIAIYSSSATAVSDMKVVSKVFRKSSKSFEPIILFEIADMNLLSNLDNSDGFPSETHQLLYYSPIFSSDWLSRTESFFGEVVKMNLSQSYKWGIKIFLQHCSEESLQRLNDLGVKIHILVIISPSVWGEARSGAEDIAERLVAFYETCKRRVEHEFREVTLIFQTNWLTYEEIDYLELIRFTDFMSEWAEKEKTTVFFDTAFDNNLEVNTGWLVTTERGQAKFESKQEVAIKIAMKKQQKEEPTCITEISVGSIISAVLATGIAISLYLYVREKRRNYIRRPISDDFFKSSLFGSVFNEDVINTDGEHPYESEDFREMFKVKAYEVDMKQVTIKGDSLGHGMFSKVLKATLQKGDENMEVAVKINKNEPSLTALKNCLCEIKLLLYIGRHENIVGLIGFSTSEIKNRKIYIFLELCGMGALDSYLRNVRKVAANEAGSGQIENDLRRISFEIASGMEFIEGKNVIHMDLAARNILLTNEMTVKICDFGFSRRLYDYTIYCKSQAKDQPLPWRWMSPEALNRMQFTVKSDVWAFGITLWEIYSLGEIPYPGISFTNNFANSLENGLRLGIPEYANDQIKLIMTECWYTNPEERPNFSQLRVMLEDLDGGYATYTFF